MLRTNIIQELIKFNNYNNYLEIGLGHGKNFREVLIKNKVCVDPNPQYGATFEMDSDTFFSENENTYDIVLVDGLHHADQVIKDIENSLKILTEGGTIVCHDMNPQTEESQIIPFSGGHWNGDCWKALVELRNNHDDLIVYTVDTDEGCAVIQRTKSGTQKFNTDLELSWENFVDNKTDWLNLITTDTFLEKVNYNLNLQDLIRLYVKNPEDPEINWKVALHYERIGHCAPAIGFYVRAAERTDDVLFQYECMIRAGLCFEQQGIRRYSVQGMLKHAITLLPDRPEAYYVLGLVLDNTHGHGDWFECYVYAALAMKLAKPDSKLPPLRTLVNYNGEAFLKFQYAVAAYQTGLCKEGKELHIEMYRDSSTPQHLKDIIKGNLLQMNAFFTHDIEAFKTAEVSSLRHRFPGVDRIERNYSESYQDMFVLSMLNGKTHGSYIEIGAGHAFYGNNTVLLEKNFEWTGISFDISEEFVKEHSEQRSHTCLLRDATTINYEKFLPAMDLPEEIDYLQIDCDPPEVSYKALLSIPLDIYKFAVITFEHDNYANTDSNVMEKSRKYLESYGYKLVVNNIAPDDWRAYEDWWVHPDLVDKKIVDKFVCLHDRPKKARNYMLGLL